MATALCGGDPNSGLTGIPAIMGLTAIGLAKALNGSFPLGADEEAGVKLVVAMPVGLNGDGDDWASGPRVVEFEDVAPNPHDVVVDPKVKVGALVPCPKVRLVVEPDPKGAGAGAGAGGLGGGVFPSNDTCVFSAGSKRLVEDSGVKSYGCSMSISMSRGVLGRGARLLFLDDTGRTKPCGSFSF